jgi:hypothetical protein
MVARPSTTMNGRHHVAQEGMRNRTARTQGMVDAVPTAPDQRGRDNAGHQCQRGAKPGTRIYPQRVMPAQPPGRMVPPTVVVRRRHGQHGTGRVRRHRVSGQPVKGEIVPAVAELVDIEVVRIIDVAFIKKDADGNTTMFEYDTLHDVLAFGFADIDGEAGGVLNDGSGAGRRRPGARQLGGPDCLGAPPGGAGRPSDPGCGGTDSRRRAGAG